MHSYEAVDGISRLSVVQNLNGFLPLIFICEVCGLAIVIMTAVWMGVLQDGGFGWTKELVFRYHPMFMILGMIFIYGNAIMVYRVFRNTKKIRAKWLHAVLNLLALILGSVGLKAVFDSHNMKGTANMYSLHSWVGLGCVILFGCQWVLGFISFLFPKLPETLRSAIMPLHRSLGMIILGLAVAAAVMGITEYNNNDKSKSPSTMLGNFIGIISLIFVSIVLFLVIWSEYRRIEPGTEEERIILND
uniref:Cytochrome b561 n=1 Tax=Dugesia japonica TaxID=6161 RepID=Q9BPQ6_DUGJA|nr:cytochrome b561 [Dugesia japonica]